MRGGIHEWSCGADVPITNNIVSRTAGRDVLSAASAVFVRDACGPDVYCQSQTDRPVYTQRDDAFYETETEYVHLCAFQKYSDPFILSLFLVALC